MGDLGIVVIIILVILGAWAVYEIVQAFARARRQKRVTDKLMEVWRSEEAHRRRGQ